MFNFAESDYNASMRRYETACAQANASNQDARKAKRRSIEDDLVEGGLQAIEEYEALMDKRAARANCLAEFDGIAMGRNIARRARARWQETQQQQEAQQ